VHHITAILELHHASQGLVVGFDDLSAAAFSAKAVKVNA
jgi:hypothetical protein